MANFTPLDQNKFGIPQKSTRPKLLLYGIFLILAMGAAFISLFFFNRSSDQASGQPSPSPQISPLKKATPTPTLVYEPYALPSSTALMVKVILVNTGNFQVTDNSGELVSPIDYSQHDQSVPDVLFTPIKTSYKQMNISLLHSKYLKLFFPATETYKISFTQETDLDEKSPVMIFITVGTGDELNFQPTTKLNYENIVYPKGTWGQLEFTDTEISPLKIKRSTDTDFSEMVSAKQYESTDYTPPTVTSTDQNDAGQVSVVFKAEDESGIKSIWYGSNKSSISRYENPVPVYAGTYNVVSFAVDNNGNTSDLK